MQLGEKGRGDSRGLDWYLTQCQRMNMQIVWVDVSVLSLEKERSEV